MVRVYTKLGWTSNSYVADSRNDFTRVCNFQSDTSDSTVSSRTISTFIRQNENARRSNGAIESYIRLVSNFRLCGDYIFAVVRL